MLGFESFKTVKESINAELEWKKGYNREKLKIRYNLYWKGG